MILRCLESIPAGVVISSFFFVIGVTGGLPGAGQTQNVSEWSLPFLLSWLFKAQSRSRFSLSAFEAQSGDPGLRFFLRLKLRCKGFG